MSSFGTAKVQTNGVNLGFPDPYSYWYSKHGQQERFQPDMPLANPINYIGDDFQAQWHQQKMKDAHYMANAKVLATQLANARAFSSPKGYFNLPPPVLGQRKFANPSMGYLDTASARQDQPSNKAPFSEVQNPYASVFGRGHGYCPVDAKMEEHRLSGGVLRTTVGQDWAKAKLQDRIKQFSAIDEAKMAFQTDAMGGLGGVPAQSAPFAGAEASLSEQLGILPQVELAQLLQNVVDALLQPGDNYSTITRFVVGDANKIFALCVRLATNNSADDIMSALEFIEGNSSEDGITQLIENLIATMTEGGYGEDANPLQNTVIRMMNTLKALFTRLEVYLKQMLKLADSPAKDRAVASKALIKSLGFLKLIKTDAQLFAQVGNANRDTLAVNPTINPATGRPIQTSGAFIAPSEEQAYFPFSHKGVARSNMLQPKVGRNYIEEAEAIQREDHFSRLAPTREDTQMGYTGRGDARFSADTRGIFGDQSGRFFFSPQEEGQYNLGGRDIGYVDGAEALAQEGGDEDGEQGEALAQLSADASSALPQLRSVRDATTGGWDIGVPARGGTPSASGSLADGEEGLPAPPPPPRASPAPRAVKLYKSSDVPNDKTALIRFIERLEAQHPGYSQAVYSTSSAKSVRLNTLRKMAEAGLL